MVKKATAPYHLLRRQFHEKYPTAQDMPEDQRPYLAYLQRMNQDMFDRVEALGWRPLQRQGSVYEKIHVWGEPMLRLLQQFKLTTLFAVFASHEHNFNFNGYGQPISPTRVTPLNGTGWQ